MISNVTEHWFYQKWQPVKDSHARNLLDELVAAYVRFAAMSAKTTAYSEQMAPLTPRLTVTTDTDPAQLAQDRVLHQALLDCWNTCYREETKSESEIKRLEPQLVGLDTELVNHRNNIDYTAVRVEQMTANAYHLTGAKQQWAHALRTILNRRPEDFPG